MGRRAKIVCTLGPASVDPGVLRRLIEGGMDCARLNFSHGEHQQHAETAQRVRELARGADRHVAIMADLQGPKIRLGEFAQGPIQLEQGQTFLLSGQDGPCNEERARVSYEALARDVEAGDLVMIDDGLVVLRVRRIEGTDVVCEVEVGGQISDRKGVNLPGAKLSIPALTEKDKADLAFAVDHLKVDYLALSFVRQAADIREAKKLSGGTPVIAKLEKPEAVTHLEAIVEEADGVMVARGDLGVELGVEKVPMVQKRMIQVANRRRKLVITATQMLDSMMRNPRPTRAEAADVANAVLDGTDAVMLSGETAVGSYPEQSLAMMNSICVEAEKDTVASAEFGNLSPLDGEWKFTDAAARAAAVLSMSLPLVAIVVVTSDGRTPEFLSCYRPEAPIVAITFDERTARRLALHWGVIPVVAPEALGLDGCLKLARATLRTKCAARERSNFAMLAGWPAGRTNTVTLQCVGG